MSAPLVLATDVRKAFPVGQDRLEILHGISLQIPPGELCAIMGPSGSGKSTFLYCLAGLEDPTSGSVHLLGRPLAQLSRAQRAVLRRSEIGFVFQSYNLVPTLTAYENVALPYRLGRERPPRDVIERTLASVGLVGRSDALPPSMSGGEQQRVALARVLARQPHIVFADEPTGALDSVTGEAVLTELAQIARAAGPDGMPQRCVVLVTHDPEVAAHCDRVVFLRDGLLVAELVAPAPGEVASVLTSLGERGRR